MNITFWLCQAQPNVLKAPVAFNQHQPGLCVLPHVSQVRKHSLWWLQGSWGHGEASQQEKQHITQC